MFIRQPGISDGAFQLRMGNPVPNQYKDPADTGMQQHECAHVSVLEEYNLPRNAGYIVYIVHIMHIMHILIG